MTWKEWLACLVIAPPLFIAGTVVLGMIVEGFGVRLEQIDRCHALAQTPSEYHQC